MLGASAPAAIASRATNSMSIEKNVAALGVAAGWSLAIGLWPWAIGRWLFALGVIASGVSSII